MTNKLTLAKIDELAKLARQGKPEKAFEEMKPYFQGKVTVADKGEVMHEEFGDDNDK